MSEQQQARLRAADAAASFLIVAYADFANDVCARIQAAMPSRNWAHLADHADSAYCAVVDIATAVYDGFGVEP